MMPSLLIVDDDISLREPLAELFGMRGYRVMVASDGLDVLRFLDEGFKPDLILLDMHMEAVDGWTLASELRQLGEHIPIVVLTADDDPRACAEQVGAEAVVAKPFDLPDLARTIDAVVGHHAAENLRASARAKAA